jgi:hypothetical protein
MGTCGSGVVSRKCELVVTVWSKLWQWWWWWWWWRPLALGRWALASRVASRKYELQADVGINARHDLT